MPILYAALVGAGVNTAVAAMSGAHGSQLWTAAWQGALSGAITGGFGQYGLGGTMLGGMVSGGTLTAINGGDAGQIMRSMAVGGVSSLMGAGMSTGGGNVVADTFYGGLGGALTGGVSSLMLGGSFLEGAKQGAIYGATAGLVNGVIGNYQAKQRAKTIADMNDDIIEGSRPLDGPLGKLGIRHKFVANPSTGEAWELFPSGTKYYENSASPDNPINSLNNPGYRSTVVKGNWSLVTNAAKQYDYSIYRAPLIDSNDFIQSIMWNSGITTPKGLGVAP